MRQTEFHISYKILRDRFMLHGASSNLPIAQVLEHILRQNPEEAKGTKPSEYKILLAKQIVDPGNLTINDLDLNEGEYLLFYRPQIAAIRLHLIPPRSLQIIRPEWIIESSEVLIGRADDTMPDVDLSSLLRDPLKISRKLAWLRSENAKWTIELHPEAHSIVFVDQVRLEQGDLCELNDGSVISLGKSLQDPDLTLKVKFELL